MCSLYVPVLRPASRAGPMHSLRSGTSGACFTVYVKCRCCVTSLFSRNGLHKPACLHHGQSPPEIEREVCIRAKEGNGGGNWIGLVPQYLTCSALWADPPRVIKF